MKMELHKPCSNCPFRTDVPGYLTKARAAQICKSIMEKDQTFSCHKTNDSDDEGQTLETANSQHCAGAMIFLEKQEMPNQWMRVGERFGWYDPSKLDMNAPVFDSPDQMIEAQPR